MHFRIRNHGHQLAVVVGDSPGRSELPLDFSARFLDFHPWAISQVKPMGLPKPLRSDLDAILEIEVVSHSHVKEAHGLEEVSLSDP